MKPRLRDLFSGAGGAAMGYHRAGFEVVGVDRFDQPHYPFGFIKGDAFEHLWHDRDSFDVVHASPPCQDHSMLRNATRLTHDTGWMLPAIRHVLGILGKPYVIENVPGAPMRADYRLCGCMFGLPGLRRERWFEVSWGVDMWELMPPCHHVGQTVTVSGHGEQGRVKRAGLPVPTADDRKAAMGIDWMNRDELAQAIPPAFTEFIGARLLTHLAIAA